MTPIQQVFLSTTLQDLPAAREHIRAEILRLGSVPIWIEDESPADDNILQRSYNKIQDADIFVGVYASSYGEIPGSEMVYQKSDHKTAHGDGKTSLPHWEYLWAMERGLPVLLFVMSETDESHQPVNGQSIENQIGKSRLRDFKRLITSIHKVGLYRSPDDLAQQLEAGLPALLASEFTPRSTL